jgi:hypothetical protein
MDPLFDVVTVTILMGLLPLAVLVALYANDRDRDAALWWIAGAFAISWLADVVADMMPVEDRWTVGLVYPIVQTTLIAATLLLDRRHAVALLAALTAMGIVTVAWHGASGPDVLLRSVASLSVVVIAWRRWELPLPLRIALVMYFGLGWLAWLAYAARPGVATWYGYQASRLAGLLAYGWATIRAGPQLRLVRRAA